MPGFCPEPQRRRAHDNNNSNNNNNHHHHRHHHRHHHHHHHHHCHDRQLMFVAVDKSTHAMPFPGAQESWLAETLHAGCRGARQGGSRA